MASNNKYMMTSIDDLAQFSTPLTLSDYLFQKRYWNEVIAKGKQTISDNSFTKRSKSKANKQNIRNKENAIKVINFAQRQLQLLVNGDVHYYKIFIVDNHYCVYGPYKNQVSPDGKLKRGSKPIAIKHVNSPNKTVEFSEFNK